MSHCLQHGLIRGNINLVSGFLSRGCLAACSYVQVFNGPNMSGNLTISGFARSAQAIKQETVIVTTLFLC